MDDGTRWVPTHPKFLFPVKALGIVFRAKFLDALHQLRTQQALLCNEAITELILPGRAWLRTRL